MDGSVELEGFDYAASLLRRYDLAQGEWNLPREGEFWDAVMIAREQGRFGSGQRVAVIDAGFDAGIPALAHARFWGPTVLAAEAAHGTAVALLVKEVAPECELLLFNASADGQVKPDLVAKAIRDAVEAGADVVNLSLAVRIPRDPEQDAHLPGESAGGGGAAGYSGPLEDLSFDWRQTLSIPETEIGRAVSEAASVGVTVVAASGNDAASVYIPAALPDAFSIGFLVIQRFIEEEQNLHMILPPVGYSQTLYSDFQLVQPRGVLGTSFASPLVAGFCALMGDRSDLYAYRDVALEGSNASSLAALVSGAEGWTETAQWVQGLYTKSLGAMPHPHVRAEYRYPCPECSLFAAPTYCDAGLWALRWGSLEPAEHLLRTARAVAPYNPDAAANLAMVIAVRAHRDRHSLDDATLVGLLHEAAGHMSLAAERRPSNELFSDRLDEFMRGGDDPTGWRSGGLAGADIDGPPEE